MMIAETFPAREWTTSAGTMPERPAHVPVLVGCLLVGLGTSTHVISQELVLRSSFGVVQTTAAAVVPAAPPAGAAIGELRRLSGLTWDQLARVFGVTRRSLHFWANGKTMAPSHEEHLHRVLDVVRKVDRGAARVNRAALLGAFEDGSIPIDLLKDGHYARVIEKLGHGEARRVSPPRLSKEARAARAPRPPEELVGALHDQIHREPGASRAAKSLRVRSGG